MAQHTDAAKYRTQLNLYQDSLVIYGNKIINDASGPERLNSSYAFAKLLVRALKTPNSFNYSFDSLKTISIQYPPDRKFRIFSWYVMFDDGSYRYYGAVQMNNPDGKLLMHGLVDYTPAIKNPKDTVTDNSKWYGAQYYSIIPVYSARVPYYLLLGWKGNTVKSTRKVIEVLSFKDNKPVFGMPVFDGDKDNVNSKRIIFEYSRKATMLLKWQPATSTVVFDHLAPMDDRMKGAFDTYGPDMSYDAFRLANGRWRLQSDLRLTNPPSAKDELFNDPKLPGTIKNIQRKL
ncbi:hypothetical protein [Hufsiella ginkgonis]|uniref:Uncharacterized protein n=1 Tax=Hufsiella ginkgonis TaxID=2695274 RepID=A0A7K1XXW3_9SPHI|nr:hypothetical protein [Hufsiella ginkgonis]MXV15668.1 hypothetical protein [Hufsiella ginkgonis]